MVNLSIGGKMEEFIEIYYEDLQNGIQKMIDLLYQHNQKELERIKKIPLFRFTNNKENPKCYICIGKNDDYDGAFLISDVFLNKEKAEEQFSKYENLYENIYEREIKK